MTTQVQFRRGTTAQHATFTGAIGEVTVDTTLDTVRVHDGATAGGIRLAKYSEIPTSFAITFEADDSAGISVTADGTDTLRISGGTNISTSTDSAGTISISTDSNMIVNTLSSNDSTAVVINDNLNIDGNLDVGSSFSIANGAVGITSILDEDSMSSNSATALATQQSIKAYVDSQISVVSTTTISEGNSSVAVADSGTGSVTVTIDGATHSTFAAAGLSTDTVNVNTLNSTDSTAIQVTDALNVSGAVTSAGGFTGTLTGNVTGNVTGNSDTATEATNVTVTANNTANETVYLTFVDGATGTQGIETDTGLSYNPSTNILSTTASSAQYADLAERYTADGEYEVGHVVVHGGTHEITQSTLENDTRIAGVISEKWAYLMNGEEDGPAVALKGKVKCKIVGTVKKGDLLVTSSTPGHAVATDTPNPFAVIGRSLVDDDNSHPRTIFIKI